MECEKFMILRSESCKTYATRGMRVSVSCWTAFKWNWIESNCSSTSQVISSAEWESSMQSCWVGYNRNFRRRTFSWAESVSMCLVSQCWCQFLKMLRGVSVALRFPCEPNRLWLLNQPELRLGSTSSPSRCLVSPSKHFFLPFFVFYFKSYDFPHSPPAPTHNPAVCRM